MKLVVVLPTYNEKDNIARIIEVLSNEFLKIVKINDINSYIIVVDDNSPDGTGDIVRELMSDNHKLNIVSGNDKGGLGKAYIKGFKYALEHLNPDIIVKMDADFSHDPKDISRFLEKIFEGYDFVIGSRYVKGGSIPEDWGFMRRLNSIVANFFARYVSGLYKVKDCTSGFRVFRASLLKNIDLDSITAYGYSFQMVFLNEVMKNNARIVEIPINFVDRKHGESKINWKEVIEFIKNSIKIRFLLK